MGIVRKEQRQKMMDTVVGTLEDAGYSINSADEGKIVLPYNNGDDDGILNLFLHGQKKGYNEFKTEMETALHNKQFVSNIFYKDGENFHVRLGYRGNLKGDDRSLKRYAKQDIDDMLDLRKLEKFVLSRQTGKDILVYYQPETERLSDGIRKYAMMPVWLDYSHVPEEDRRFDFLESRKSIDFKIAKELATSRANIGFEPRKQGSRVMILNPPKIVPATPKQKKQLDLF